MIFKRKIIKSDQELILAYQKDKNKQWVGELYNRYSHLVFGVCLKYLKNKTHAQDATSAIFEELFDKLQDQIIDNFSSWLYTFSKNHCLMQLRKKKTKKHGIEMGSHLSVDQVILSSTNEEAENKKLQEIALEEMEKAIENLSKDQKECITYFYLNQMSYDQVASKTNLTLKQVKSAIQNGKRNLKNALIKKT